MGYYVVVTFDLPDATAKKLSQIEGALKEIGLRHEIGRKNGKAVNLPTTTYFGKFNYSSAQAARDGIRKRVRGVFEKCRANGEIFVFVPHNMRVGYAHIE